MPPKGVSNNPSGRPKGTTNKVTTEIRTFIGKFLKKNLKGLQNDWDQLTPYQRTVMAEKLLAYAVPKVNDDLSHEDLDEFIERIKQLKKD